MTAHNIAPARFPLGLKPRLIALEAAGSWPLFQGCPFFYAFVLALLGKPLRGGNEFIKLSRRHLQAKGNPHNAFKRYGALGPFNPAYFIRLIAAKLCQPLLGEVTAQPQLLELLAEQNQCVGHAV